MFKRAKAAGYKVYALTDNVNEIVAHLQSSYDFWQHFDGEIISAKVGLLKPQPEIYHALLSKYDLVVTESVFLDDMVYNVQGAQSVGLLAIQFKDVAQCEKAFKTLGIVL